jgi:uncharacterized protein
MILEQLIIFTRYPEPGKAKTRLIPVLGTEGAANLHRLMAEWTIANAISLQKKRQLSVAIYYTGSSQQVMQDWFGTDLIYHQQLDGDLGTKMSASFQTSFDLGIDKVVIIGTDCPKLKAEVIAKAFDELSGQDLVLGPAKDGGYYLIGLRRTIPELFNEIKWGTNTVFADTLAIAENLDLNIAVLPILADIDRPEDLLDLDINILK